MIKHNQVRLSLFTFIGSGNYVKLRKVIYNKIYNKENYRII